MGWETPLPASICSGDLGSPLHPHCVSHPHAPLRRPIGGTPQPLQSWEPVPYHEGINLHVDLCYWSSREDPAPRWAHHSEARSFHGLLTPLGKDATMTAWPPKAPVSVSPGPRDAGRLRGAHMDSRLHTGGLSLSTD